MSEASKERLELREHLNHENRICTIESTMNHIDKTLDKIDERLDRIEEGYKKYFWKAFGAMGTGLALFMTAIQIVVPYIHN